MSLSLRREDKREEKREERREKRGEQRKRTKEENEGREKEERTREREQERGERGHPCVGSKRLRMYVQNASVCAGKTRAPTVLPPLRIAEQIFGIPAPQRGGNWSLHGPLPGQSSTLSPSPKRISERIVEQIAVSSPAERISKRTVEQIVDISPDDDRGQVSSSSAGPADEDFPGGFRTFPYGKKVRSAGQVSADLPPARQLIHAGGSARLGSVVGVLLLSRPSWRRPRLS